MVYKSYQKDHVYSNFKRIHFSSVLDFSTLPRGRIMTANIPNAMTVSYGSFSVTLKGYDQPFELLKEVTDYYSKVARENPGFGAVPSNSHVASMPAPVQKAAEPRPQPRKQPIEIQRESIESMFETAPKAADNLWHEPAADEAPEPLVLETPISQKESADLALIYAAGTPLMAPEVDELVTEEPESIEQSSAGFLSNNYPFRHFPLRNPRKRR
jgi:hypothetical protein